MAGNIGSAFTASSGERFFTITDQIACWHTLPRLALNATIDFVCSKNEHPFKTAGLE
jgi:hypothetical protein